MSTEAISYSDISSIVTALGAQISVANIVAVLASLAAIAVIFVFMWWGIRKAVRVIMASVRKGKLSL